MGVGSGVITAATINRAASIYFLYFDRVLAESKPIFEKAEISLKQEMEALKALSKALNETDISDQKLEDRAAFELAGIPFIEDDDTRELFLSSNPEQYRKFVDAKITVESSHDRLMGGSVYRNALPKTFSFGLAAKQKEKIPGWAKWTALGGLALVLGTLGIMAYYRGGGDKVTPTPTSKYRDPNADDDGDGMPNGLEIQLGLNPDKPSIYPFLNKARQAIEDMTKRIQKIKADYDEFDGTDIGSIKKGTQKFRADIQPAIDSVNSYKTSQTEVSQTFQNLMKTWSDVSLSSDVKLQKLREYNQAYASKVVPDYSNAKGTLAWHINEKQEAGLSTFNQDQDGQHFQSVFTLAKEGIGLGARLRQLVNIGNLIYDQADKSADLFAQFRPKYPTETLDYYVPGHIGLWQIKKALEGATKQLQFALYPDKLDLEELGKTYTDSNIEYFVQPKDRATLKKLLNNLTDSEGAHFLKIISEDNSDFGTIQLVNILGKGVDYEKQIAGIISKGLKIGSIKTLSDFCSVGNSVISPWEDGYNVKFAPENYELLQKIENREVLSDIELARKILALVPVGSIWDTKNVRLFNSSMNLEGRKAESCIGGVPSWYVLRSILYSDSKRYEIMFESQRPSWIYEFTSEKEGFSSVSYRMCFKPFLDGNIVVGFQSEAISYFE